MAKETLTVREGFTFFPVSARGNHQFLNGVIAGETVELDTDSEEFRGQCIKFVEYVTGKLKPVRQIAEGSKVKATVTVKKAKKPATAGTTKPGSNKKGDDVFPKSVDKLNIDDVDIDYLEAWSVTLGIDLGEKELSKEEIVSLIEKVLSK